MITPKEAKELSQVEKTVSEYEEQVGQLIKKSALLKKKSIILRDKPFAEVCHGDSSKFPNAVLFLDKLKTMGYRVTDYVDYGQFADVGIKVEW